MLGLIDDVSTAMRAGFSSPGAIVMLLGGQVEQPATTLAGSEYLESVHGLVAGLPVIDLGAESRLQKLVLALHADGSLLSAHDCSEGGLAVALVEACLPNGMGFAGDQAIPGRLDAALFGEAQGRVIVSLFEHQAPRLREMAARAQVPVAVLGRVTDDPTFSFGPVEADIESLRHAYETPL
jgi:phosphoribosylformylglycinamidine synthase